MIARLCGASARASLVVLLVVTPGLLLPSVGAASSQLILFMALLAGALTFVEYAAASPSIVEFRDAAPFNRLRFLALFGMVFLLTAVARGQSEPTLLTGTVSSVGMLVGQALDAPLSPLRVMLVMLTDDPDVAATARTAAGLAALMAAVALALFAGMVRGLGWPGRGRVFNMWVNLPLFDPSLTGDALLQLKRDARFNVACGLLLPFLIPVVVKLTGFLVHPVSLAHPQTLIWTVTAWAFLPASTIMRGLALGRIAAMIEAQRRQARVARHGPEPQPA